MRGFVRCSTIRYAVIQASIEEDHPERLVIAYPNENTLRDLIAPSSIVGLGFMSREEATATLASTSLAKQLEPRVRKTFASEITFDAPQV